jgi:hypothetical protein
MARYLHRTRFALGKDPGVPATQTPQKKKVMVEMSQHDYDTLRASSKHHERTMSAHIRYLIKRELKAQ